MLMDWQEYTCFFILKGEGRIEEQLFIGFVFASYEVSVIFQQLQISFLPKIKSKW